jgi:hypothetical protein
MEEHKYDFYEKPTGPGFGVTLDPDFVAKATVITVA